MGEVIYLKDWKKKQKRKKMSISQKIKEALAKYGSRRSKPKGDK